MTKSITILGSTGVIGTLTLEVLSALIEEPFHISVLAAGTNVTKLAEQVLRFRPQYVSVATREGKEQLLERILPSGWHPEIGIGEEGLLQAASIPSQVVVSAIVGARGLLPTWMALQRGAIVALANKETLVAAGELVMTTARTSGSTLIPVDSEHSALFQCLQMGHTNPMEPVERLILTASGGPFREWSLSEQATVTPEQALRHPNWTMGKKITVDSATLMNKGLEVIEAHHLFGVPYDKIEVLVHPQSAVHSLVAYHDGSVLAQLASADMRIPIQYALTYPNREQSNWPRLDLAQLGQLTFESPDFQRFPSLRLAYEAGKVGGLAPCVLNAANEVAVNGFLDGRISFLQVARLVEEVLQHRIPGSMATMEDVLEADRWARRVAQDLLKKGG
ncbi:1-deoxy-D-xylulose-5-phosphate reductoisomerase [Alicyclobacillaceae bacterium I2511]|nr:1-deoxy-D-xylulose-5-phosphate reductoisomerase [Alicyclobacillaceae bacterium I2511]